MIPTPACLQPVRLRRCSACQRWAQPVSMFERSQQLRRVWRSFVAAPTGARRARVPRAAPRATPGSATAMGMRRTVVRSTFKAIPTIAAGAATFVAAARSGTRRARWARAASRATPGLPTAMGMRRTVVRPTLKAIPTIAAGAATFVAPARTGARRARWARAASRATPGLPTAMGMRRTVVRPTLKAIPTIAAAAEMPAHRRRRQCQNAACTP